MLDRTQTPLIRSRSVVPLHLETDVSVTFVSQPEEGRGSFVYLTFERQRWEDMDRPQQITVSVEPGDKLNEVEDSTKYDSDTMFKVQEALIENGYLPDDIPKVISSFQNRGILFRERA
jgi:hypothetical protein